MRYKLQRFHQQQLLCNMLLVKLGLYLSKIPFQQQAVHVTWKSNALSLVAQAFCKTGTKLPALTGKLAIM